MMPSYAGLASFVLACRLLLRIFDKYQDKMQQYFSPAEYQQAVALRNVLEVMLDLMPFPGD
jgi:hypothetical protein